MIGATHGQSRSVGNNIVGVRVGVYCHAFSSRRCKSSSEWCAKDSAIEQHAVYLLLLT